ncbi:MAG: GspE/PulE family protein, partial [Acidobacteriota bacterium]
MRRLTHLLYALATLTALLGVAALVHGGRRAGVDGVDGVLTALGQLVRNAGSNSVVWMSALGWGAFAAAGRYFEGAAPLRKTLAPEAPTDRPVASRDDHPAAAEQRRGGVERLRLEALLRGRSPEVSTFVDRLVARAVESGASDIHLQPAGVDAVVTLRVRGELREIARYPAARHADVVRRLKVLAELPPYKTAEPQDARLAVDTPHGRADIRLSTVPSTDGERVALRLAGDGEARDLEDLGLLPQDLERLRSLLEEPQGLVVLTGPTGSGKTTTLYSALQHIHRRRGSTTAIASIEDPVEVELPFLHQVAVDRTRGVGFAAALRSVLRQDPNVLMVGEIRDAETAKVAVQACLSGHLILTTLHAESTLGVFPRLIDLGVEPFLAASSTLACVSQRLVPRLCPECRHTRSITSERRRRLGVDSDARFFTAEGCAACDWRGVFGRVAVFEILTLTPELRRRIAAKASPPELVEVAAESGTRFFADSALELAARGEISLDRAEQIAKLKA